VTTDATGRGATLYPAIDLRGGRCVRLQQGSVERETVYREDPFAVAEEFVKGGAEWIHVVDLDAAFGEGSNRALVLELARRVPARVQAGGGYRSEHDLEEAMAGSVARVIIGTAALESPELVRRAVSRWGAERIAVGLDARGRRPAVRGWREESTGDLFDLARGLADLGVATFLYTDISRDGMMEGPNLPMSIELAESSGADVLVSGGVSSIEDIDAVRVSAAAHYGIAGVVVGRAIYEGRIDVKEAVLRLRG